MSKHRVTLILGIILLVLIASLLSGCDTWYNIRIENRTEQEVRVYVFGWTYTVAPCSFQAQDGISGPITFRRIEVVARSEDGQIVYDEKLKTTGRHDELPKLSIEIGEDEACACATPVPEAFIIVVQNRAEGPADVVLAQTVLGTVAIGEEKTFGPIEGDLDEGVDELRFVDSQHPDEFVDLLRTEMAYSLCDIPRIKFTIDRIDW